ncbi:hypothetical protein VDG1235_963 [Verrucomicrobiia bacterium DG1235]|nr:hypothetical protein VDG1235_963 [Verrucomicrobiae bacterium DG1235]
MRALLVLISLFTLHSSLAASDTPIGLWRTIDDKTGEPKSLVRITQTEDGILTGHIEEILNPAKKDNLCEDCKGERHNQPILGMTILWGFEENGSKWTGGEILDPNNGKIYSAYLKPKGRGESLEVRGYIGISLIGRSQTWQRAE